MARDFDKLNDLVHPGPWALVAGFRPTDPEKRFADWFMGPQTVPHEQALQGLGLLVEMGVLIAGLFSEVLRNHPDVLSAGRVVFERVESPQTATTRAGSGAQVDPATPPGEPTSEPSDPTE